MNLDCIISCETLKCEICGKSSASCSIRRNCQKLLKISNMIGGPGTELKKLLSRIGIKAEGGCKCNDRAIKMDEMERLEPGWCERNIDEIVGWLEEEAKKRGLPFIRAVGKMLVKRAIKNSQQS